MHDETLPAYGSCGFENAMEYFNCLEFTIDRSLFTDWKF
jgi:hypothetical protein